jgi:predicted dehydrogenase
MEKKIKVAVIGVGSIGVHHSRIFSELEGVELVGIVDIDEEKAQRIAEQYNCRAFRDYSEVIGLVDTVSIAVPTLLHYRIALDFLQHNKDIFVEKPITSTREESDSLLFEADKRDLIIQVGHLERFNAGVSLIGNMIHAPKFIESSRLSPFQGRGTDVDVTLDLMIHDIDIILSLVKSDISELRATGTKVLTGTLDIAYAWLEFKNGCIAEVVASRIADNKVRQLKVFQQNAYLNLNYLTQEVTRYTRFDNKVQKKVEKPEEKEPLKEQFISFIECLKNRTQPLVSGVEGKEALQVALQISELIHDDDTSKGN